MFRLIILTIPILTGCNAITGIEEFNVKSGTEDIGIDDRDFDSGGEDTNRDRQIEEAAIFETSDESKPITDVINDVSTLKDSSTDIKDAPPTDIGICESESVNPCGGCGDKCKWNDSTVSCKDWLALKTCSLPPAGGCIKCGGPNLLVCGAC